MEQTEKREPIVVGPLPKPIDRDRITANLSFYHQHPGEQPTGFNQHFDYLLQTEEQPWQRRLEISESELVQLDTGWLGNNVGYLIIQNREGTNLQVTPTEEEKNNISRRIIGISAMVDGKRAPACIVRPGQFFCGEINNCHAIYLECFHGTATTYVHIFPR